MKRILSLCTFLWCYPVYSQVVTAPVIYAVEDGQTSSGSPSSIYGTTTTMEVSKTASSVFRSFVKFDLDTIIPSNAIITSAVLRLTPSGTENITTNSNQLYLDVCNSFWFETSLSHSSNISNNAIFPTVTASTSTIPGKRDFQVKDMVQAMIERRTPNFGFRVRRNDETNNASTIYFTSEHSNPDYRPQLYIQYYAPAQVTSALITHAFGSSSNGSISPKIAGGSTVNRSYQWYSSSGILSSETNVNVANLSPGWYGLRSTGSEPSDVLYQAFIVGNQCEDISFTFDPGPNYIDDARPTDLVTGTGNTAIHYSQTSSPINNMIVAERWTNGGTWYGFRSLVRFRLWVDPIIQVNTATMTLTGNAHNPLSTANSSELVRNTSYWTESGVAFTNLPSFTSTGKINIPGLTGSSNATLDIASFFNTWKTNNLENYGFLFQLQAPAYVTNSFTRMQFHSSDVALAANHPKINFILKATGNCTPPSEVYATLFDELDGAYYTMKEGKLHFVFNQHYDTQNSLQFNIYNHLGLLHKTSSNFPAVTVTNGENYITLDLTTASGCLGNGYFVLEVISDKKEKTYLRFYNEYASCTPQGETPVTPGNPQ